MITLSTIGNAIQGKSFVEVNNILASAFTALPKPKPYKYQGIDIEIQSVSKDSKGLLSVICQASKDGKGIPLNLPFEYVNPPILIPDGTKETIIETINKQVIERQIDNFKEDLPAALKEMVGETVLRNIKMGVK